VSDQEANGGGTAHVSIAEQRETYVREDGSTYTRDDIFVRLHVTFRDRMLSKLKGPKLSVYLCIALHCDEAMTSFPSISTIAEETGYSRTAVIGAVRELHEMGLIAVGSRKSDYGDYDSNLYQIRGYVSMGGSTLGVLPVVNEVYQGSTPSVPKEEPIKEEPGEEVAPPPTVSEPKQKPRDPDLVAGYVYKDETGIGLPSAYWARQVVSAVGTEQDNLQFWRNVIRAWLGKGWRKDNVSGMLECYRARRLPGEDRQRDRQPGGQSGGAGVDTATRQPIVIAGLHREPEYL